jgi:hypothetical protein
MSNEQIETLNEKIKQIEIDIGLNKAEIQRLFKAQKKLYKEKTQTLQKIVNEKVN